MPPPKTQADHRQVITRVLRSIDAPGDVCNLILDNFDCACKVAMVDGYQNCTTHVLNMANSLKPHGQT